MEDKFLLDFLSNLVVYYINRINEKNFDFLHLHYLNFSKNFILSNEALSSILTRFENDINKIYKSYCIRFCLSDNFDLSIHFQYIPNQKSYLECIEFPFKDTFKPLYDSSKTHFRNHIEFPFGNIFEH